LIQNLSKAWSGSVPDQNALDCDGSITVFEGALSRRAQGAQALGVSEMECVGAGLADGETAELRAEAAEARALARQLAKRWDCRGAVVDLEKYARALESIAS